jgi:hypothetical protein
MQVSSKINGSAAWPAEGENPNMAVAPTVFAATSSNEQKSDLTCTVCGITSTSQKAMQDHLEGKLHRKKAAMLPQPMPKDDVVTNLVDFSHTVPKFNKAIYMFYFGIANYSYHLPCLQLESVVFPMHFLIQHKFLFSLLEQIDLVSTCQRNK